MCIIFDLLKDRKTNNQNGFAIAGTKKTSKKHSCAGLEQAFGLTDKMKTQLKKYLLCLRKKEKFISDVTIQKSNVVSDILDEMGLEVLDSMTPHHVMGVCYQRQQLYSMVAKAIMLSLGEERSQLVKAAKRHLERKCENKEHALGKIKLCTH